MFFVFVFVFVVSLSSEIVSTSLLFFLLNAHCQVGYISRQDLAGTLKEVWVTKEKKRRGRGRKRGKEIIIFTHTVSGICQRKKVPFKASGGLSPSHQTLSNIIKKEEGERIIY